MLSVPVSSTGQAPAPASDTNLPGADLDARRVCAMEGAHLKSGAIIASSGAICVLGVNSFQLQLAINDFLRKHLTGA